MNTLDKIREAKYEVEGRGYDVDVVYINTWTDSSIRNELGIDIPTLHGSTYYETDIRVVDWIEDCGNSMTISFVVADTDYAGRYSDAMEARYDE